jgi:hypothetical protein
MEHCKLVGVKWAEAFEEMLGANSWDALAAPSVEFTVHPRKFRYT